MIKQADFAHRYLLITGCYRSGTTLVDKFLSNHHDCMAFSQPFTSLFINTKKAYYAQIGVPSKKFLGVGVPPVYDATNWAQFLHFKDLQDGPHHMLRCTYAKLLAEFGISEDERTDFPSDFFSVYLSLLEIINRRSDKSVSVLGAKEILCHEYISYLINKGIKVVLIIRDPRHVIESLNYGTGDKFTGGIRPTLLNLHNWREIAEIGLRNQHNLNLMIVRYEDFICEHSLRLKLLDFLELSQSDIDIETLRQVDGSIWRSNSSFTDKPRMTLDISVRRYVESICFFEMNELGYQTEVEILKIPEIIRSFQEPWTIFPRNYYEMNYSTQFENINFELERWNNKMSAQKI